MNEKRKEATDNRILYSIVMLEQIRTIDKKRLKEYIAALDGITMGKVDKALAVSVGLRV